MYRFSIEGEEWIVRFSPQATLQPEEKETIVQSISLMKQNIRLFSHGEAFLVVDQSLGFIVFKVEKIPSLILTVCSIIPIDRCYFN